MFQGSNEADRQNFAQFPFVPSEIDIVILSHAHIDHSGRLPLLVKRGFKGNIYCTDATADLLGVMLRDSAHIQEKETEWKNRKAERSGAPLKDPLYTMDDVEITLKQLVPVLYDTLNEPMDGVRFVMNDAGHILGSAVVELWAREDSTHSVSGKENWTKLVFSGDLGQAHKPMLRDPVFIKKADCVLMESTYGSRVHEGEKNEGDSVRRLADIVINMTGNGGTVVIPSFAVGRAQELIYGFNKLMVRDKAYKAKLEKIPFYVDSPMAVEATEVYKENAQVFDDEYKSLLLSGDDPLNFLNLIFTRTQAESMAINADDRPKVIISASGMCEAGRIRHHLKHHLWRKKDAVVFVGYQAANTLGRKIMDGAASVDIFGEPVAVNASIFDFEGFSAHADRNGLLAWAKAFQMRPQAFFLVHGEEEAKLALGEGIVFETSKTTQISPTVVTGVSEFALGKGEMNSQDVMEDIVQPDDIDDLRLRIAEMQDSLSGLLAKADAAVAGGGTDAARIAAIKNKLIELEKGTVSLASSVAGV
jgi:metallo-beta-lactamase family protein